MNEIEIDSTEELLNSPAIGYTLLDGPGSLTNSAERELRVIRVREGTRFSNPWPQQECSFGRRPSEYAIALLVGCLLGFLTHMLVDWIRKKRT